MYKSFKRYINISGIDENFVIVALITLLSIAFSQSLYGKPFFLGLSFLFLIFNKREFLKLELITDSKYTTNN